MDRGTSELSQRHAVRMERGRVRVMDGNAVDRALCHGLLSIEEHSALTGFQVMLHRAGWITTKAASLERVSGRAFEYSDKEAELRLEVNRILKLVASKAGEWPMRALLTLAYDDEDCDIQALRAALPYL